MAERNSSFLTPANTATVLNFLWNRCSQLDTAELEWLSQASSFAPSLAGLCQFMDHVTYLVEYYEVTKKSDSAVMPTLSEVLPVFSDLAKTIESMRHISAEACLLADK